MYAKGLETFWLNMCIFVLVGSHSAVAHAIALTQHTQRRPRSEKKAIPDDAKDDKYFERRKRNNHAAKKSRDARKSREDEIAIRASFLEKENAILRAQVATLREEANSLRQLLLQKRSRPWGVKRTRSLHPCLPTYSHFFTSFSFQILLFLRPYYVCYYGNRCYLWMLVIF